jgi:recombination protein RecA
MEDKNRSKAIDLAVASIEKEYGKGSIMRLKEGQTLTPTCPSFPRGASASTSRSASAATRAAHHGDLRSRVERQDDAHPARHRQRAEGRRGRGVHRRRARARPHVRAQARREDGRALISQPDYGEQALEIADMLVRSGAVDIIVIDSVAALVPKAEIEGDMGDSHVGLQARLMSQALRKLTSTVARSNCLLIFINQIRMKIGVMFGSPETTTGGNALKFYASDPPRHPPHRRHQGGGAASGKKDPAVVGNRTRVKVVKNKMAPPFREVEFDILYGQGISRSGDVIDLAAELNIVEKSGAWFSFGTERIGQGRENAKAYLEQHPE